MTTSSSLQLKHELEYLIKWRGYPDSENTWVPLSLMSCQDLLQEYDGRRQQMQPSTQGRRDGNGKLAPTNSKRSTEAKVTEKAPQQPVEPKEPGDKEELKKKEDQEKDEKETEYEVKAILDHRKVWASFTMHRVCDRQCLFLHRSPSSSEKVTRWSTWSSGKAG